MSGKFVYIMESTTGVPQPIQARAEVTVNVVIEAAIHAIEAGGEASVRIDDILQETGISKGSLYHHFGDKESLFLAVFDAVQRDLMAEAARRHQDPSRPDHWTQLRQDLQIALDTAMDPAVQQVKLIDAPAVLGWKRWRELESRYGLGAILKAVENSIKAGLIRPRPAGALAHLIWAAYSEGAMMIVHSDTPVKTRAEAGEALDALLAGLI